MRAATTERAETAGPAATMGRALALGLALVVATACGGESTEGSGADAPEPSPAPQGAAQADGDQEAQRYDLADLGVDAGDPDAPIHVVEFSDFGCPHCRAFHEQTYATIHEEYVETGHVVWKYVPYVLGSFPNSVAAARAGECAIEQDAFPPLRDRIFEEQDAWTQSDQPNELFVEYAADEGLDVDRFRSCIEEQRPDERVQATIELGRQIGVRGTPTFFIEGQPVQGNRPADFFRQVFDRMLADLEGDGDGTDGDSAEAADGAADAEPAPRGPVRPGPDAAESP